MFKTQTLPGVLYRRDPDIGDAPLLCDSPHSGRDYPGDFAAAVAREELRHTEDAWVDELIAAAPAHGAVMVAATFPRAYVDVNRGRDEIDPDLLSEPWPGPLANTDKVASGVGLVWKLIGPARLIYDRKLALAEVEGRIARCYDAYHREMEDASAALRRRFGVVYHVNWHSMPSLGGGEGQRGRPDFCIGDLDGRACERGFTELVARSLAQRGYRVSINDPFKGAEIVRRHGDPARGRHSLQIEINRRLYMDETTTRKGAGFERVRAEMGRLLGIAAAYARERAAAAAARPLAAE